jgi:hypothetical protein
MSCIWLDLQSVGRITFLIQLACLVGESDGLNYVLESCSQNAVYAGVLLFGNFERTIAYNSKILFQLV